MVVADKSYEAEEMPLDVVPTPLEQDSIDINEASSMYDETTMEGNGIGADEIGQEEGQAGDGGEWFSTSLILTDILTKFLQILS